MAKGALHRRAQPNNGMQRSADTMAPMFLNRAARPLMPSVRLLGFIKSMTETCHWQRGAALS
jgi:hypothetical protein